MLKTSVNRPLWPVVLLFGLIGKSLQIEHIFTLEATDPTEFFEDGHFGIPLNDLVAAQQAKSVAWSLKFNELMEQYCRQGIGRYVEVERFRL